MTALATFTAQLCSDQHRFADTLNFIANHYRYQPSAFSNGSLDSAAGQNEGSCKVLSLALLEQLDLQQTLLCFGEHYRDVLATPNGSDHGNIRALMQNGLAGVVFKQPALQRIAD